MMRRALILAVLSLCIAVAAQAKDALTVRFASAGGIERMILEWASTVTHRLERKGQGVTLTFDRAAPVDVGAMRSGLSQVARGVEASTRGGKLTISFQVNDGFVAVATRNGARVDVEFLRAADPGAQAALEAIRNSVGTSVAQPSTVESKPNEVDVAVVQTDAEAVPQRNDDAASEPSSRRSSSRPLPPPPAAIRTNCFPLTEYVAGVT